MSHPTQGMLCPQRENIPSYREKECPTHRADSILYEGTVLHHQQKESSFACGSLLPQKQRSLSPVPSKALTSGEAAGAASG